MDDFRTILKVENNSGLPYSIRSIFNGLGDDPELYPFDTGVPEQSHCFLRFSSPVFAEYALTHNLDLKDVRVIAVRQDPRLIAQYQLALGSLLSGSLDGKSNSNNFNTQLPNKPGWSHKIPTALKRDHDLPRRRGNFVTVSTSDQQIGKHTSAGDKTMARKLPALELSSTPFLLPTRVPDLHLDSMGSLSNARTASKSNSRDKAVTRNHSHLLLASAESASVGCTLPITFETRISMALCGEVITYDLEGLNSDPRVIIELLKVTNSERANYMVVAAFYRRSGNPHSARAVLLSMVKELSKRGVSTKELKPAFLLLSGCEVDLAKQAKADKKDASEHYAAAQVWLQEVFGKAEPLRSEAAGDRAPVKRNTPTRPRALLQSERRSNSREIQMEQEIQKLRERNSKQAMQLSDLRASKRKLEEDYFYERDLRRKCQRQREDMEKERDAARNIEKCALDQVKREVVSRRKAEALLDIV